VRKAPAYAAQHSVGFAEPVIGPATSGRTRWLSAPYIYLIASGLVGEPTAPVMGIAGATNMNS
jgi:hypothetical protein